MALHSGGYIECTPFKNLVDFPFLLLGSLNAPPVYEGGVPKCIQGIKL